MELGNHAEFLGVCSRTEMLSEYFTHDGGETSKWRLKGHAEKAFWRFIGDFSVMLDRPSDIGESDEGYDLPLLRRHIHLLESDVPTPGYLFEIEAILLSERRTARSNSMGRRVIECAELANASNSQWLVWCDYNREADAAEDAIDGAVQIAGSDDREVKRERMLNFGHGRIRALITKPKIAGFGMNWQNCWNVAFLGVSDSYEAMYQAVRRCWRFGQTHEVNEHLFLSTAESAVLRNQERKQAQADQMRQAMVEQMKESWDG
jgi:hypothetical protein